MDFKFERLAALIAFLSGIFTILSNVGSLFLNQVLGVFPTSIELLYILNLPVDVIRSSNIYLIGFTITIVIKVGLSSVYLYAFMKLTIENHKKMALLLVLAGILGYSMLNEFAGLFAIISAGLILIKSNNSEIQ